MERTTSLNRAKEIMGKNFVGPVELKSIEKQMGIYIPDEVLNMPPAVQFDEDSLEKLKNDYILIFGIPYFKDKTPLTIVKMREHFGCDPAISEPCFYNQDWYLNEKFANKESFILEWYLIKKLVFEEFRGQNIKHIQKIVRGSLPSAILCAYVFFSWFLLQNEILWKKDYTWCEDKDQHEDQIYGGRYTDEQGIKKNGFEIHRHLSIKNNYSCINFICNP